MAVAGAEVAEPSLEEQAATNRTRSETAGQKIAERRIRNVKIKKVHPKSLESKTAVSNKYELLCAVDGIQTV